MSNSQVPKVNIQESVGSLSALVERGLGTVIPAIIGTSEMGTANTEYKFGSVSEAEAIFGSNTSCGADLMKLVKRAFDEGASKVIAVSIGTPTKSGTVNEVLTADALAGADRVVVGATASLYEAGDVCYLGSGTSYEKEEKLVVASVTGTEVVFETDLQFKHYISEVLQLVTPKASSDYEAAIDVLESNEEKTLIVCEDSSDAVATLIHTMLENSYDDYATPCIYIRGPADGASASATATTAEAVNNDRVVMVYPNLVAYSGRILTGGETAAALAGLIARNGIPKLNHNFSEFTSVGGVASKVLDFDALISAGVSPIELKYNSIHIVRFLTTYTTLGGIPSTTWSEGAVRANVDYIEKAIQRRLQGKFLQSGNTPETRLAIKTECVSLLETFKNSSILVASEQHGVPAYRDPIVSVDGSDDTKVNVQIELSPGKPLNFITLNFKVML